MCKARLENRIQELPVKSKGKKRRIEQKTVLVIRDGERFVLQKRPDKGILAGMYEFPNAEGILSEDGALNMVREMGLTPLRIQPISDAKHIFSHVEWHMKGYLIRVGEVDEKEKTTVLFVEPEDTKERYPIPAAYGVYANYIHLLLGSKKARSELGE